MNIRRSTYNALITEVDANGHNSNVIRAVALAIFVKHLIPSSCIKNFSWYKLHKLTGLHYNTLKKRLQSLERLGLVERMGKAQTTLRFKRIASKNARRNINLSEIKFDSVADVEKSLLAMFVVEIQRHKDFYKQVFASLRNPKDLNELKWARNAKKRCGNAEKFVERGLSYKTIAEKLHIGVQKAIAIVKWAVENKFLRKIRPKWSKVNLKGAFRGGFERLGQSWEDGFTFVMSNCVVLVKANRYKVGSRFAQSPIPPVGNIR